VGRDGRACGKREEGARWLLKPGGGVGRGVPHGAGAAWGLAPTGGIGSGRERRDASDARVRVCRPEKKKKGWSSPDEQCGFGFI
jgi:hypothetical protein